MFWQKKLKFGGVFRVIQSPHPTHLFFVQKKKSDSEYDEWDAVSGRFEYRFEAARYAKELYRQYLNELKQKKVVLQ